MKSISESHQNTKNANQKSNSTQESQKIYNSRQKMKDWKIEDTHCKMKFQQTYASIMLKIEQKGNSSTLIAIKTEKNRIADSEDMDRIKEVSMDDKKIFIQFTNKKTWQIRFQTKDAAIKYNHIFQEAIKMKVNRPKKSDKSLNPQESIVSQYSEYPIISKIIEIISKDTNLYSFQQKICHELKQFIDNLKAKEFQLQNMIKKLREDNNFQALMIASLRSENETIRNFDKQLQGQYEKLMEQLNNIKMNQNIPEIKSDSITIKEELERSKDTIKELTEKLNSMKQLQNSFKEERDKKAKQISSLRLRVKQFEEKQQQFTLQKTNNKQKMQYLENRIRNIQKQIVLKQDQINKMKKIPKQQPNQQKVLSLYNKMKSLESQLHKTQKQNLTLINNYEEQMYLHIFEGNCLQNNRCQKQYLKETIQKYQNRKILQTKILFKYDPKSTNNFHHYVDGHPHIVLIIKTKSGMTMAGYSQSCIKKGQAANKGGLIVSMSNRVHFELLPKARSVTYDEFYIIFGNSELRIKSLQNKLYSNFGINSSFYACKGHKVDTLIGQGTNRDAELEDYEIHQLIFK